MVIALLWSAPFAAVAQTPAAAPPAPVAAPQTPATAPQALATAPQVTAIVPDKPLLRTEELDQLVAPIALYPDTLLSQVLIAATYPLEVVQAERWINENKHLKGDPLKAAVDKQAWDDGVKALVATPSVLIMMSQRLDWTQKLGDAVLAQQSDVMDAIQRLRARAQANNKLVSTKQQKVIVRQEQNRQVIAIEPAVPDTVYVPYYDPGVVYGAWPYPAYPPYYWPAPGYIGAGVIATGIAFGAGYALGRWVSGGRFWGGSINWGNNNININRTVNNINGRSWQHNVAHRHGVRYSNADVRQKFGGNNIRAGQGARQDFRGRDGQRVAGDRPGGGDRRSAGDRPGGGDRPGAGDRGSRDRPQARDTGARREAGGARDRSAGQRAGGARRDTAFSGGGSGGAARAQAARGRQSFAGSGASRFAGGGGGARSFGGGGGFRGGGGGGFRGGGGGGRRSDIALKHDITLLGHLDNGLGFYRFSYNGSDRAYVGVMAQEVQQVMPQAVVRGRDGYLRVFYDKLGLTFQTYEQWMAAGARIPAIMWH